MPPATYETIDQVFCIRITPARQLVEIGMFGFWSQSDLYRFEQTLRRMLPALAAGGCAIGNQLTLFDLTGYSVQSQAVLAGLAVMAADPAIASRRIAITLSPNLIKRQARRAAPDYGLFTSNETAMEWLTAGE